MAYDLTEMREILKNYFSVTVPDNVLIEMIDKDNKLQDEIKHNSLSDTCAREYLISVVCQHLNISVPVKDMFGKVGSCDWPCYGDSDEYNEEFFKQLPVKLEAIGGTFIE